MPVWNGETFLGQTIESLLVQDYGNFELIILDNLSTDRTPKICKVYAQKDPSVKYLVIAICPFNYRLSGYALDRSITRIRSVDLCIGVGRLISVNS